MRRLLAHRLSSGDAQAAKQEWYSIVEGEHPLWEVGGGGWVALGGWGTPAEGRPLLRTLRQ